MANSAQIRKLQIMRRSVPALADDDMWHSLLKSVTGKASSRDLSNDQVSAVVAELVAKGAADTTPRKRRRPRPNPSGTITPQQLAYIEDNYRKLGWKTFPQKTGFNERCCGKQLPQTHVDDLLDGAGPVEHLLEEAVKHAALLFIVHLLRCDGQHDYGYCIGCPCWRCR